MLILEQIIGYISTLAKSYPFDEEKDVSLGTAYSSIFMVVQMLVIYNLGGLQLIKGDFDRPHSDVENAHGKNSDEKNPGLLMHIRSLFSTVCAWFSSRDPAMAKTSHAESSINALPATEIEEKHKNLDISKECDIQDISVSPPSSNTSQMSVVGKKKANTDQEINLPLPRRIWLAVQPFVTPPSISLVASIVIANVPQLKALFIHTPEFSMRDAPDSRPPLDFIMEITGFAGPCVPVLGLLLLGAAFSRLSIKSLPQGFWKSVVAMACLKLVVGPIIGMVWTTQLTQHTSMINESDKMLRFVMIMASGTPSATSQIYLTTIFAPLDPKGSVEMSALSALLLAQYALMMVTLTVLVSYTLFNVI
ncbi:hypothetical protein DFH27DRAFT_546979 [Peziza echinospora]|nr:hypothetical protein DFH27DRAFT_546979 [Peziza echinospora]